MIQVNPRDEAKKLLKKLKIKSYPVPVDEIAKSLGAQVLYAVLDDELSGMAYINNEIPVVGVNSLHHPNRQRFTLAHEIGHLVMHKEHISNEVHVDKGFRVLPRNSRSSQGIDRIEIEANQFASELLMPKDFLMSAMESMPDDIDDEELIDELAKKFEVSRQAMDFRLGALANG